VELRPATADDLPELHALFLRSIGAVYERHSFDPPRPPLEVFANQQGHVLSSGACVVAHDERGSSGFASAWVRGDDWFLASLFVSPEAQGRGLGALLLDSVWGEHRRRRTITDAIQPVSNALYGRRGLVPATPILSFSGTPRVRTGAEPGPSDLRRIDLAAYGFDRAVDHAYWGALARRTTWPGAYSYAFPGGTVGPVAGETPEAAAAALAGELARAEGPVAVRIPGSARALVEVALGAGLQLSPTPGLLLGSAGAEPPAALAISSYTLY
jgi:GNAT superfamily N-acetyltransferase